MKVNSAKNHQCDGRWSSTRGKMNLKSKKGLSPLIATVLLIAFAIALGVVVMSWGRNYVREVEPEPESFTYEIECASTDINIPIISSERKICYGSKRVEFFANNVGSENIIGFKISIYGNKGIDNVELPIDFPPGETVKETINYDEDKIGDKVELVKIIPVIKGMEGDKLCTASATDVSNIRECEI